jgi:pimeloyl-ACP methyl ester carboxylesterase
MIREEQVRLAQAGFSTRVLRTGTGSPRVLLLHGSPDSAGEWRPVMEALGDEVAACAPDLPGLGAGEEPPASFDYSRAANDRFLDELLAALGAEGPLVMAVHDIGGVYGVPWAARRRDRIRGLLITNTVVFEKFEWFFPATVWAWTGAAGRLAASALMSQIGWFEGKIFRAQFARISPELAPADLDRMTREFACDAKSKRSTLRLFRQMVPHAYFEGFGEMVRELIAQVPVKVIWGRGDPYIPARYADAFPGAPREISERGGHWIPITEAKAVASAIRALLK